MKIFDVVDNEVALTPECLLIKEIKDIVEKFGDNSISVISYLEFLHNPESPFSNLSETDKAYELESRYLNDYGISASEPTIILAGNLLKRLRESPITRAYRAAVSLSDKLSHWAENVVINDDRKTGNINVAMDFLTDIAKNMKALNIAMDERQKETAKARGNKKIAYDQD